MRLVARVDQYLSIVFRHDKTVAAAKADTTGQFGEPVRRRLPPSTPRISPLARLASLAKGITAAPAIHTLAVKALDWPRYVSPGAFRPHPLRHGSHRSDKGAELRPDRRAELAGHERAVFPAHVELNDLVIRRARLPAASMTWIRLNKLPFARYCQ